MRHVYNDGVYTDYLAKVVSCVSFHSFRGPTSGLSGQATRGATGADAAGVTRVDCTDQPNVGRFLFIRHVDIDVPKSQLSAFESYVIKDQ